MFSPIPKHVFPYPKTVAKGPCSEDPVLKTPLGFPDSSSAVFDQAGNMADVKTVSFALPSPFKGRRLLGWTPVRFGLRVPACYGHQETESVANCKIKRSLTRMYGEWTLLISQANGKGISEIVRVRVLYHDFRTVALVYKHVFVWL